MSALPRFEAHPTPKRANWPNMAEIEISVFSRGCLSRPVPSTAELAQRVTALEGERNAAHATIDWPPLTGASRSWMLVPSSISYILNR